MRQRVLKDARFVIMTSLLLLLLFVLWVWAGWSGSSVTSMQWTFSVITQSMAVLLGLVLGAYALIHEQAIRAIEQLRHKQVLIARKLLSILPSLIKNYLDLRSADPYWQATWRKLATIASALPEIRAESGHGMVNDALRHIRNEMQDVIDEDTEELALHLATHPEKFLAAVNKVTNLAPLEPGYPDHSVLSDYRHTYEAELGRYVRTIERQGRLSGGIGRVLPGVLAITFFMSIALLSLTGHPQLHIVLKWGLSVVLALSAFGLALFTLVAHGLLSLSGHHSSDRRLLKVQAKLRRNRLSA